MTRSAVLARLLGPLATSSWGFADQALLSATSFVTMIVVARVLSPASFGAFALLYTTLLFTNGLHGAIVTQPHNVLGVPLRGGAYRRYTGSTAVTHVALAGATGAAILVGAAGAAALGSDVAPLLVALAVAAVAWMTQEFVRRVLYTEGRLRAAFANDLVGYGGQAVGIVALWRFGGLTAASALYVLAVTSALGVALGAWQIRGSVARSFAAADARGNWDYGKWLAGAFVAYWFASQLYLYLSAALLGTAATGTLKAALVVMGPLNVLLVFVDTTTPISLTRTLAADGEWAMHAQLKRTVAWVAPLTGAYCLTAAVFAGPLLRLFFGDRYATGGAVLGLYALHYFVIALTRTLGAAVRAKRLTRYVFTGHVYAAVVSLALGWLIIEVGGVRGAVVGTILSGVIAGLVLLRGYLRSLGLALARPRLPSRDALFVPAAAALGAACVVAALVSGHSLAAAAVAAVPLLAIGLSHAVSRLARVPRAQRMVGALCLLLLAGTFVWRTRTTQELQTNPLDAAGLVRVALVAAAALLAVVFLLAAEFRPRLLPTPLRFLAAYAVVAALAAVASPLPLQAAYRAFELGAGLLAALVALVLLGDRAGETVMRIVIGTIGAIVALVWIEALVLPSRAWSPVPSLLPYELQGVMPVYSSNTVGTLGGLLAIWGLARPGGPGRAAFLNDVALVLGLATLVAAQYRTGAIGFLAVGALVAWRRRRSLFVALAAAGALAALFVGAGAIRAQTETAFAKGNPDVIATLDSRTVYWQAAVPAIRERPLLGWGLNVGSRRVLVSLGEDSASTIHDTWVEAVLGTGVVGAALLAGAFLTGLRSAWLARRDATGVAVGAMLAFLVVRSITGSTAELFDVLFLVFVGLVFAAAQLGEAPRRQTRPLAASTTHGGYVPC